MVQGTDTPSFWFMGGDYAPAAALTTSWTGHLNLGANVALYFYGGQHKFNSGLTINEAAGSQLRFQGTFRSSVVNKLIPLQEFRLELG